MNSQFDQTPGLHLPQPATGALTPQPGLPAMQGGSAQPVSTPAAQYNQPQVGMYQPPQAEPRVAPGVPVVQFQQSQPPPQVAQPPMVPTDVVNDDDTVLDEEWVNKAREVVARYSSDPFAQSRELSRVKAQYLKTRYNKDIKVSEDK